MGNRSKRRWMPKKIPRSRARGTEFKQNLPEKDAGFPLFWEMIDNGEAVCGGTISSSQELLDLIAKNKGRRMVLRIG